MGILKNKRIRRNARKRKIRNRKLTVPVIVVVTDGGDFGFDMCKACSKVLPPNRAVCPYCGAKLVGTEISPSSGGSDF